MKDVLDANDLEELAGQFDVSPDSGSCLPRLEYPADARVAIFHHDDLGMCHGANAAFGELAGIGTMTCGAAMVPCPWFTEVARMAASDSSLDLGVHLTLTSEWATYRWAPISTTRPSSGLIDPEGYFWRRLPMLAAHVEPEAAEAEMRAQIERALAAGIDVTHLDAHMGAALLPALVGIYLRLGFEYRLPVLLPRYLGDYTGVLELGDVRLEVYQALIADLLAKGVPLVDHFRMTPGVTSAESDQAYRRLVTDLPAGLTVVALHPNQSGDIEAIVPAKAHFRTDEYRILRDPSFLELIARQKIHTLGFRPLRDLMRNRASQA